MEPSEKFYKGVKAQKEGQRRGELVMNSTEFKRSSFSLSTTVHNSIWGSASARKGSELDELFVNVKLDPKVPEPQDPAGRVAPIRRKKALTIMFLFPPTSGQNPFQSNIP